jgi:hypothetical protein
LLTPVQQRCRETRIGAAQADSGSASLCSLRCQAG